MTWYEKIIACHVAVTDKISHGKRMKSDRYFVWQEDGADTFLADQAHAEAAVTGTTDLYTKIEFDPWKEKLEEALESCPDVVWELNSIQFEQETGYWHYEWIWSVI